MLFSGSCSMNSCSVVKYPFSQMCRGSTKSYQKIWRFPFRHGGTPKKSCQKIDGIFPEINYHVWGTPIFRNPQIAPILGLPPIPRYPQAPPETTPESPGLSIDWSRPSWDIADLPRNPDEPRDSTRNEESIGNSHRRNSSFFGGLLQVQVLPIFS